MQGTDPMHPPPPPPPGHHDHQGDQGDGVVNATSRSWIAGCPREAWNKTNTHRRHSAESSRSCPRFNQQQAVQHDKQSPDRIKRHEGAGGSHPPYCHRQPAAQQQPRLTHLLSPTTTCRNTFSNLAAALKLQQDELWDMWVSVAAGAPLSVFVLLCGVLKLHMYAEDSRFSPGVKATGCQMMGQGADVAPSYSFDGLPSSVRVCCCRECTAVSIDDFCFSNELCFFVASFFVLQPKS